jgi:hypothetical protein
MNMPTPSAAENANNLLFPKKSAVNAFSAL